MRLYYLAHPITHKRNGLRIGQRIEKEANVRIRNPFCRDSFNPNSRPDTESSDSVKSSIFGSERNLEKIVYDDIEAIKECDGIIALVPYPSIGTSMEICLASVFLKKQVIIVSKSYSNHPWIKSFVDKTFLNEKELIDFLKESAELKE